MNCMVIQSDGYHNCRDISAHLPAVKADDYRINAGILTIVESKDQSDQYSIYTDILQE